LQTSFIVDFIFKGFDILPNEQFGFCPKISTEIASYSLINKVAGIFFDLGKVFDCVNQEILLHELEFYVYRLLKLYLQNRCQRLKIENGPSDKRTVKHGVPQGYILGPLLFLLYINDLQFIIKYSNINANPLTTLLADDISIIISNLNSAVLGNNLKSVFIGRMKWFKANLLSLNLEDLIVWNSTQSVLLNLTYKLNIIIKLLLIQMN
jgi:hypothetical protein